MTVSSATSRKTFTGDGATTAFATSPIVFFDDDDLTVYLVVTATGVATLQTKTTHYTVTGGAGSTGTVTMLTAPASTQTLVIVRELDLVQEFDPVNNDSSDAEALEDAIDKLTMMVQQLDARVDRSFALADSDVTGASTELPTPAASKLIGWNSGATALTNYASASIVDTIVPTAFMETLLDDANAATARVTLGTGTTVPVTSVSGTNTVVGTIPTANSAYTTNGVYIITPAVTNTGATTVNFTPSGASALGAKNVFSGGAACVGGELVANVPTALVYDGTQFNVAGPYNGGLIPAGQIKFPAAQSASSDANTLDDYEEGSWTPVLTFTTPGDLAVTYTTQIARYIKIGRLVTVSFAVVTSAFTHTTASGSCQITGLPFAAVSVAALPYVGGCTWRGITKANFTDVNPFVDTNSSVITFYISGSGQVQTTVATGDMPTGGTVVFAGTVTYFAAN